MEIPDEPAGINCKEANVDGPLTLVQCKMVKDHEKLRVRINDSLGKAELLIYSILAALLFVTALATIANAGKLLWEGLRQWTIATETLRVLDQLLLVLMLVEILHTVRISIQSHILVIIEPFLVVGLIAFIRRILVISLEAAALTKGGSLTAEGESMFRTSMIELALLGLLILILVVSIALLRRYAPTEGTPELQ
jgi:uncharacterized membrane protein (DUF373 family)